MLAFEIKILALTILYFTGWFIFEKFFSSFWDKFQDRLHDTKPSKGKKIQNLSSMTPLDQTSRYIKGLKSPDWRLRRISCIQLGEKRGSLVVQALIEALNDPREEVSIAAGDSLAKIGDPTAITALTSHVQEMDKKMDENYERFRVA
ncbi:HEAT repeat domain-containing protein [bacterium]|nr:HEAT repeat domain-containing protein [bacterium]